MVSICFLHRDLQNYACKRRRDQPDPINHQAKNARENHEPYPIYNFLPLSRVHVTNAQCKMHGAECRLSQNRRGFWYVFAIEYGLEYLDRE